MANGAAGNETIRPRGLGYGLIFSWRDGGFRRAFEEERHGGGGATKLLACTVNTAPDEDGAAKLAKAVIMSNLVKAAFFGADANWGRILCAMGYAGVPLKVDRIAVRLAAGKGEIAVCRNGAAVGFDEDKAKTILLESDIGIHIDLKDGEASGTAWGCDLTYDYVKINGDYRS
jgi:glutamate N-acetyltransferase/amino-acid N-acetyltransferase